MAAELSPTLIANLLFTAVFWPLRDHLKRDDPVLILHIVARYRVQRLPIRTAEGHANYSARRRDQAQIFAVWPDHLNTRIRGHVEASGCVKRTAITGAKALSACATFQLRELALIGERAIFLYIKPGKRRAIGDIEMFLVSAQHDPVGIQILSITVDLPSRVRVKDPSHGKVHSTFVVHYQIVEDAADAVDGIVMVFIGERLALRRELLDRFI